MLYYQHGKRGNKSNVRNIFENILEYWLSDGFANVGNEVGSSTFLISIKKSTNDFPLAVGRLKFYSSDILLFMVTELLLIDSEDMSNG